MIVEAREQFPVDIGFVGENEARQIRFDVSEIISEWPTASIAVLHKRPGDSSAYPVASQYVNVVGEYLYWSIQSGDVESDGKGECQLVATKGSTIVKTVHYRTRIGKSLDDSATPPDPWTSYVQEVIDAAETVKDALTKNPRISDNETWEVWDETQEEWVDTQVPVHGDKGDPGDPGLPGQDGAPGVDGVSPTVSISDIVGGHTVTITDKNGDHDFNVMNGETGEGVPSGGTTGQVLAKKSSTDYDAEWVNPSSGGTSDYADLDNKPQIAGVTLSGNKSLSDLGIAAASAIPDVTGKADKVSSATNGNFAALDGNGNLTDSGHKHSDYLTSHQDITGKADKVSSATNGNFAGLDSNGNLTDSGKKASDFLTSHQDISGKADKVSSATSGHFAGLDSNGNLTDSGKSASDFGTYSKPSGGIPSTDMTSAVQTSLGKADSAYQKPSGGIPSTDIASGVLTSIIDDTAGDGDTDKVYSADKVYDELTDVKSAINGKYTKPADGIPASDLSSSFTGFIGDTDTDLGSTTETTITDLTNMTAATATEGNVQLTITKTHITAYGVCNATRIRTLQDNIVCSAGNYEFSVGTIIPTAGYQIQVFSVTDNEVVVSAAASATSPVITFTLASQKTLRLRALVTSGKSIDSSNEVYLHKVVSASTPNTLASVAKGIVDGHLHGKNILAFGDSLWGDDRTNGIADFLAEYSGATIYNAGIGGTRVTGDRTTSEGEKFIPFDGVTLINAFISGTWTDQDAQINNIWAYVKNDTLPMLKALDLQTIDIVILAYGTNDFTANKSISDVSSAFLSAVSALLTANPKLRIICILPPWRMFSSNTVDGDTYENSNNDTLQEFNEGIISAIKPKHTETMNMFEQLPWRAETKTHYMDSDAVHPNRNGNMVYAHVVNGKLKTMY